MENDPGSVNPVHHVPQPLQPGILLESVSPTERPPPNSECSQMQLTPYSYYGDETYPSGENQSPINALSSTQEPLDGR